MPTNNILVANDDAPFYNYDLEQKSDEWRYARLGLFTGSDFHVFLGDSKTKEDKLWEKMAERRYQDSDNEEFFSPYTERGNVLENEARRIYSAINECEVKLPGLVECRNRYKDWAACSPDGIVGEDGIIEIKCLVAKFFTQYTEGKHKNDFYIRPEYKTQVQFNLFVTQRKWCDFIYYHPRGGIRIQRIFRDEEYIKKIEDVLDSCIIKIEEMLNEDN